MALFFAIPLLVVSALCGLWWGVVLYRAVKTSRSLPTARDGVRLPGALGRVLVVVPAHNEEASIAKLLDSLREQTHVPIRVVVACDRCTDRTAEIAQQRVGHDERFRVLELTDTDAQDGWAGKTNAVWNGLQRGFEPENGLDWADFYLFTDADTWFEPRCIEACVALAADRQLDMLSLISTMPTRSWYELLVQPAAGFELFTQYPLLSANKRRQARPFANGQFMLFRKAAYHEVGGHAKVSGELLEDLALARRIVERGHTPGVFLADGMMFCRMYDTWQEFKTGWQRIFIEAGRRRPDRLVRSGWRQINSGVVLPIGAVSAASAGLATGAVPVAVVGGAALVIWLAALTWAYRLGAAKPWAAVTHPLGAALVARVLFASSRRLRSREAVEWGGRRYVRTLEDDPSSDD